MKQNLVRFLCAGALSAGAISLHAAPAAAGGTIFAVMTLTNATSQCIPIPASGAKTSSAWGTQGNTMDFSSEYMVMPDGTPPRFLAPGQTMLWGTKSNGGTFATSGTGGSLTIPLASQNATMSWSVPWSYFNGVGGSASGSASAQDTGGFAPTTPFEMAWQSGGCGDNTCNFEFQISGGPPPSPGIPAGQLGSGQCMSMPTGSVDGQSASGITVLRSPDGSTTLEIVPNTFGTPSQWGGVLTLSGPNGTWLAPSNTVVAAQMTETGNFVAFDSYGDVVWQSSTGYPGAFLAVGSTSLAVEHPERICFSVGGRELCENVDHDDWVAPITPKQVAQ